MVYYLNVGSNLGNQEKNIEKVRNELWRRFGYIRETRLVESEPWGFVSGNRFVNAGIAVETEMQPEQLLDELQGIEKELSAVAHRNADGSYKDREIDIDIMSWGNGNYDSPRLHIPHIHLYERPFFIGPLQELERRPQIILKGRELLLRDIDPDEGGMASALLPSLAEMVSSGIMGLRVGEVFSFPGGDGWRVRSVETVPSGFRWVGIRDSWSSLGDEIWSHVSRIAELTNWDASTCFCGSCGSLMRRNGPISKSCPSCGRELFPQLSPAIVVLVRDDKDRALLVHAKTLTPGIHALVAGFVETGECLEECVSREVREETSLEVGDIRYYGSQSWPFPGQLMVAFTARLKGGSLCWADGELTSGGFFSRDELPSLPGLPSLSRRLIDSWISGEV